MKNHIKPFLFISLIGLLMCDMSSAFAQLNPLGMQYFNNQYLGNPAMAGLNEGLDVKLGLRQQWNRIDGAPTTQSVTAEYRLKKAAFALNLYSDAAGLLKRTRVAGTYAYHLPLNDRDHQLHFGVSLAVMFERIKQDEIDGDPNDMSISRYTRRESYIDGDFGIAYTLGGFTLQGAVPNLQQFINEDKNFQGVDRSVFLFAASYKWTFGDPSSSTSLHPKVTYRGIKGHDNIVDLGFNLGLVNDKVGIMAMYHSSKSATFGLQSVYRSITLSGMYTTETAALSSYTNGAFQLALGYRFTK